MKTTIFSYIGFFIITIQLVVLGTIIAKSSYQQTIEQSVEDSMTLAANMLKEEYADNYAINMELLKSQGYDPNETTLTWSSSGLSDWKKEFVTYLSNNIDSRITDLSVEFYAADESKGILSANVTVKFKYLNGKIGEASCYKTIVLNTNGETSFDSDSSGKPVAEIAVAPTAKNLTYNGKEQVLVNKGYTEHGTIFYRLEETGVFSKNPPTAIDAGTYSVYYMIKGDGTYGNSAIYKVPVTIQKASASYIAPTARSLTYNKTAQALLEAGSASNGCKIQYRLGKNGAWSSNVPEATKAGSYDVYYRIVGTNNYADVDSTLINITIRLATPTVSSKAVVRTGLVYNGNEQELIQKGSATNGTLKYSLTKDGTYSDSVPKATNAGTYTIYMKVFGDENYDVVDAGTLVVTIGKASLSITKNPSAKNLTYNGSAQELISEGTPSANGKMQYKVVNGTNANASQTAYASTIPTGTNAGTYTVYYKVVATNTNYADTAEKPITVIIEKATPTYKTPSFSSSSITYNGSAQTLINSGFTAHGKLLYGLGSSSTSAPSSWSESVVGTNAGTYYVWYKLNGDSNHASIGATYLGSKVIAKANPVVTAPTALALGYTGSAQKLVSAGSTTGGTMMYSLDSASWSSSVPTASASGKYTIYYYVQGNGNYNGTSVNSVTSTIMDGVTGLFDANGKQLADYAMLVSEYHFNPSNDYADGSMYNGSNNRLGVILTNDATLKNATKLVLPNGITKIGRLAISECDKLTTITLPDSLTTIGEMSFFRCQSLTAIDIPSNVTSFGANAFNLCFQLQSMNYKGSLSQWTTVSFGNYAASPAYYAGRGTITIGGTEISGRLTIPSGVTKISAGAFSGFRKITHVRIPSSVTSIGDNAFNSCTGILAIGIPDTVTAISGSPFSGCSSSMTIYCEPGSKPTNWMSSFNSGFTTIWGYVAGLYNSSGSLLAKWDNTGINIDKDYSNASLNETMQTDPSSGYSRIKNSYSSTYTVKLPVWASRISHGCFGYTSFGNVYIPDSYTEIGIEGFGGNSNLRTVTYSKNLKVIGAYAFSSDYSLTGHHYLPNGLQRIDTNAFALWNSNSCTIHVPSSVTYIHGYAFGKVSHIYYYGSLSGSPWGADAYN